MLRVLLGSNRHPRRRAALPVTSAALILAFGLYGALSAAPAAPPPAASPATSQTPTPGAIGDLAGQFQQLEAAARALDPAAPDAVARLRGLVERLAHANARLAQEVAQLRAALEARTAATVARSTPANTRATSGRASRGSGATTSPSRGPGAAGKAASSATTDAGTATAGPAAGSPIFAKRGLKKFHRVGCVFGERIRPDDRVGYADAAAAVAAGLEPCKVCRPE